MISNHDVHVMDAVYIGYVQHTDTNTHARAVMPITSTFIDIFYGYTNFPYSRYYVYKHP